MERIDHKQTMVLIIGVSEFPEDTTINAIPNVLANIQLLKSSLTDPELIGIPESNISVSTNEDKSKIERKLKKICEETHDKKFTLLIYYSGYTILSSSDYKLYLTTHHTIRTDLEIEGIHIDTVRKYVRRSRAARKIVILDCCHSGAYIKTMGDVPSTLQAGINDFEGTYIMTSAAADEPALFPVGHPEKPTYFTGKLVEILHEGLDNEQQFCTLREIYDKIEYDFETEGLPQPQQSSVNTVDQFLFSRNKKYVKKKPADESAWEEALKDNTKWFYFDFREQYPLSVFSKHATRKISELEEEELWNDALNKQNSSGFANYLHKYPNGKFINEASHKILELEKFQRIPDEKLESHQNEAISKQKEQIEDLKKEDQRKQKEHAEFLRQAELRKQEEEALRKRELQRKVSLEDEAQRIKPKYIELPNRNHFNLTVYYPKLLSKRFTARFVLYLYIPEKLNEVIRELNEDQNFKSEKYFSSSYPTDLITDDEIIAKLSSHDIEFSECVIKILSKSINKINFLGKPLDRCFSGNHVVKVSILDKKTNQELNSMTFEVRVVDFAFGHISRPLLSRVASVTLATGSLITFFLTSLGKVDQSFGLASGTAAAAVGAIVYSRFLSLFRLQRSSTSVQL